MYTEDDKPLSLGPTFLPKPAKGLFSLKMGVLIEESSYRKKRSKKKKKNQCYQKKL